MMEAGNGSSIAAVKTVGMKRECGIVIPFILLIDANSKKDVKIGDPEKMAEMKWFSFNNLPQPLHSGFQKTILLNKTVFKRYSATS